MFNPNIHPCYINDMNKQNQGPAVKYKKCISRLCMKLKTNHMLQHSFFNIFFQSLQLHGNTI